MKRTSVHPAPVVLAATAAIGLLLAGCNSSAKTSAAVTPTRAASTTPAAAGVTSSAGATAQVTGTSASVDSCSVITQPEAAAALGRAVRAPVRGKATVEGGVACVFYGTSVPVGTDPDVPVPDSVRAVLVTGPDAKKFFDDYRSKVPAQTVSGLGDEAYYDGSASLSVLKGSDYLRVAVIGVPHVLDAETQLAREALPRM